MKLNKVSIIIVSVLLVLLLTGGCLLVVYEVGLNQQKETENRAYDYNTFADHTDIEAFATIPVLEVEGANIGDIVECGTGVYSVAVGGTTLKDYKNYVSMMQEQGFKRHSDNGEDGIEGYIFSTSFQKGDINVTVYHIARNEATYIVTGKKLTLSDHLNYQPESMQGISADAKTKVHLLELNDNGNSYVIQLKNGHFIIEDGGNESDAPYLLDYLESLTPGEEKPVVEAWFMTHAHTDHYGALKKIMADPEQANRIYVDGFYFVDPSTQIQQTLFSAENPGTAIWFIMNATGVFKRADGSKSQYYRPSLGQRYYFCDITIDITLTMDQFEEWYAVDFNDTSTWFMHTIEGQKFLHAGDAAETGCKVAMDIYDKEYFNLELFSVLHHGINVYNYFTDYCKIETLLYTNRETKSLYIATWAEKKTENDYLKTKAKESLAHGEGTVILTFPYKIGTSEKAAPLDWKYNNGKRDGKIWDVIGGRKN